MNPILFWYLVGCVVQLVRMIFLMRKEKIITVDNIVMIFFFILISWLGVLIGICLYYNDYKDIVIGGVNENV
jgi:hypothetical protein